ncbi:hypothetical protein [Mucisphaera calidilacus]|uniref:Uncharacterized protein n=1 Tax=Mucisphaera calidilacus TaxID=2527982 RepID=A0A518BV95_9BACT|nr:hypothetical protein [Mucisphaera calidilacus]QDU70913.1 hypothetical protein Pan265_07560 [Mucisphaera calidilacus]
MPRTATTAALTLALGLLTTGCTTDEPAASIYTSQRSADNAQANASPTQINLSSSDALGFELFGVIDLQPDRMAKMRAPRPLYGQDLPFPNTTEFAQVPTD